MKNIVNTEKAEVKKEIIVEDKDMNKKKNKNKNMEEEENTAKIVLDEDHEVKETVAPKNKISTTTGGKSTRKAHKTRKNRKVKRRTYHKLK
jgi:hypothetical protein